MDVGSLISDVARGLFGPSFIVFALAAMGLNIHFGYTGLLNFGQAVFMAAGAYGLAATVAIWMPSRFWPNLPGGYFLGIFLGVVVLPGVLTLIMGAPALRLRADYLAIVTIAVSEIFRFIIRTPRVQDVTGASDGLTGFAGPFYDLSPFDPQGRYLLNLFTGNQFFIVLIGWVLVALGAWFVWLLVRSPWGRVLKAIREDEDAALSLGKNVFNYKLQALYLGGMLGAVGGLVRALANSSAQPDNFITDVTFQVWVALILGGAGKVFAPIVGASLFYGMYNFTDSFLRQGTSAGWIPSWLLAPTEIGQVRFMLIGICLILLAVFRPQGIFGNKEEMALDDR